MGVIVFYNRCKLLSHIRSHAFKYATITVTDLKIEPLPLEHFDLSILSTKTKPNNTTQNQKKKDVCYECKQNINKHGVTYKDRAAHYMQLSKEVYTCPICTFLLPTVCALEAHLRIHLNMPPYFCPECGTHLSNKVASYPFDHDCEGFKMMKSATRYKCTFNNCDVFFQPSELAAHFKTHLKKIVAIRCTICLEMWYNESQKDCTRCNRSGTAFAYSVCPLCPNKLFKDSAVIERHLNSHFPDIRDKFKEQVYPCMNCYLVFQHMHNLLNHHVNTHSAVKLKAFLSKFTIKAHNISQKSVYHRVIKKCSKCFRSFTYRCLYENIKNLPNDCPYKCSTTEAQNTLQSNNNNLEIECFLCKRKISQNWDNIKVHYAEFHKNHKCLDVQVLVKKLDKRLLSKKPRNRNRCLGDLKKKSNKNNVQLNKVLSKVLNEGNVESKKIPRDPNVCIICNYNCENSQGLESHIITHRDPCMAYQCLECGKCFVVKPSFSTHLLIEHGISDVQEYIDKKPSCFNELALLKDQNVLNPPVEEPLKENQCRICREQFENPNDLEKHFRVHGMAFLLKNAHKSSSSPSP